MVGITTPVIPKAARRPGELAVKIALAICPFAPYAQNARCPEMSMGMNYEPVWNVPQRKKSGPSGSRIDPTFVLYASIKSKGHAKNSLSKYFYRLLDMSIYRELLVCPKIGHYLSINR